MLAAEDYTGPLAGLQAKPRPQYLSYYLDALAANGIAADVYDVDANGREAPSPLGVLSHYNAVIWYTGDDMITRESGMVAGTASRLANDEMLAVRQYLNEGGSLLYTGKYAGLQYAQGYEFNLETNAPCDRDSDGGRLQALSDDFLQYYLGAYIYNEDAGTTAKGKLYDVLGADEPFTGLALVVRRHAAGNQDHGASFIATSGLLPRPRIPQFDSWASAKYNRPGGPFDPHTGAYYAYSQIADIVVQAPHADGHRTGRRRQPVVLDVARHRGRLGLRVRRGTHCRPGRLDDAAGPERAHQPEHRAERPGSGELPGGLDRAVHPLLAHYQTHNADDTCTPTGTTGVWNAASGNSNGWEQWSIDLSAYAGKQVEISIAYATDWSTQGLGVFVDDTTVSTGDRRRSRTASAAGPCRARLRVAPRTRMTGSRRPLTASPKAPRSRRPTRSTSGSGSRGSRRRRHGMP